MEIFLLTRLDMGTDFVNTMGPITVNPTGTVRPAHIKNEYTVTFANKAVRDAVRASASKLGASSAPGGIRLEVPDYLQGDFRALENIAFKIKKKNPTMRRNVKLDDDSMGLVMDIKLDDTSEWSRILPEHARQANAKAKQPSQPREKTLGQDDLTSLVGSDSEEEMYE